MKSPRMHSEIVLPVGQMKDQHKQCKLAAIFVIFVKHVHYPQCLFRCRYVFNAEFIIQIPGKCRLRNFYLVLLLKIRTDKVTT